jgi:hypothetical protein
MAYIGPPVSPYEETLEVRTDVFNGNGSNTVYNLTYSVVNPKYLEVLVNNVQQNPFDNTYSVSGNVLTFSTPPGVGSNNIYVIYREYFRTGALLNSSAIITDFIAPLAVTTPKIANGAVTSNKLADTLTVGNVTVTGTMLLNQRADQANSAVQKQYVDALTIIFGA